MQSEFAYLFSFSSYKRFRALLLCFLQHFRISRNFAWRFSRFKSRIWTPQVDVYMYSEFRNFSSLFKFFDHSTPTRFPENPLFSGFFEFSADF